MSVFWVHAGNTERFHESYSSIAIKWQIPGYDDPKADLLLLVKRWLEAEERGWWLMVVDNADDVQLFTPPRGREQAVGTRQEQYLGQYIPNCAHGSILVTTRNKQAGLRLAPGKPPTHVSMMDDDESEQLLREYLGKDVAASSELLALSSRLEHLPLALAQAAAFIEENSISVGDYLRLLDQSDHDLVELLSEEFEAVGRDSTTPRAVTETWILSFDQIKRQNVLASSLLSLMSFFDRQAIPIEFLAYYAEEQGHGEMALQKALGVLKAFSFVIEGSDSTRSLNLHRLVQLVSRKWLEREKQTAYFADQALLAVSCAFPHGRYENWTICRKYLPHAYEVLAFEGVGLRESAASRAYLFSEVGSYLIGKGHSKDAERLILNAVNLIRTWLGPDHRLTLSLLNNLASTYSELGRWKEAEKLLVQVIENEESRVAADHLDIATSLNNLALIYMNGGRWAEAENLQVQALEMTKIKYGADHPQTLVAMGNLASLYDEQGRCEEAEKLQVQVIEAQKTKLGADHPGTLRSLNNLTLTYKSLGRLVEAEKLQAQVMETRQSTLGPDHPDTLVSLNNLALTYQDQGRLEEAEKLLVQVLETRKKKLGAVNSHTLTSMSNLAVLWKAMGRHEDAERLLRDSYTHQLRILGPDHPDTILALRTLDRWTMESDGSTQE